MQKRLKIGMNFRFVFLEAENDLSNTRKIGGRHTGCRSVNNQYERETTSIHCQFVSSVYRPVGGRLFAVLFLLFTADMEQTNRVHDTSASGVSFVSCLVGFFHLFD